MRDEFLAVDSDQVDPQVKFNKNGTSDCSSTDAYTLAWRAARRRAPSAPFQIVIRNSFDVLAEDDASDSDEAGGHSDIGTSGLGVLFGPTVDSSFSTETLGCSAFAMVPLGMQATFCAGC